MKLINERVLIRDVAARWRSSYRDDRLNDSGLSIGKALAELDPETATAEQVNSIIGNRSWTIPDPCSECGNQAAKTVIQLGQEPDYESCTAWICLPCLKKAAKLAKESA